MSKSIEIKDIKSYTENMSKGIDDKLFFLNKIKFRPDEEYLFVDFGCADGTMISAMYEIFEAHSLHAKFIGYDISEEMIRFAKSKFNFDTGKVLFTTDWEDVEIRMGLRPNKKKEKKTILILSSVIHEVLCYANCSQDIRDFWDRVLKSGFDYVCVRDMMLTLDADRKSDEDTEKAIRDNLAVGSRLKDFEERWGSIAKNENLIHFLLKYKWKINWDRELNENYLPKHLEYLMNQFKDEYNVTYLERFRVPYLEECWKNDFGIELTDYTHVKLIFEQKKLV